MPGTSVIYLKEIIFHTFDRCPLCFSVKKLYIALCIISKIKNLRPQIPPPYFNF